MKPLNLMLDKEFNLKLIDFGTSRRINEAESSDSDYSEEIGEELKIANCG